MNTFFCRAFQCCFAVGARFLSWRTPQVFSGEGSLLRAADILRENALRRPFVIASRRQCADEHFRAVEVMHQPRKMGLVRGIHVACGKMRIHRFPAQGEQERDIRLRRRTS